MKRVLLYCLLLSALAVLSGQAISNVRVSQDPELGHYTLTFDLAGKPKGLFMVEATAYTDSLVIHFPPLLEGSGVSKPCAAGKDLQIFWNPVLEGEGTEGWHFRLTASEYPLVLVEGGHFEMGSSEGKNYEKQHRVFLPSFYISKYELRMGEFSRFVDATGYKTTAERGDGALIISSASWEKKQDANWKKPYFPQSGGHPVTCVTWYDAVAYCNWRSRYERLDPAYSIEGDSDPADWQQGTVVCDFKAGGYRLPTEAEWEYAARGGSKGKNLRFSGSSNLNAVAWYWKTSGDKTHLVGTKYPNELGLFDMSGNVFEWCWDWYEMLYYLNSDVSEPKGADKGITRVYRGGSWHSIEQYCSVYNRYYLDPFSANNETGFRILRSAP
jgi:formylglycine-generating enzyme required for sulfatase activity